MIIDVKDSLSQRLNKITKAIDKLAVKTQDEP
jgi:hypothetical protein